MARGRAAHIVSRALAEACTVYRDIAAAAHVHSATLNEAGSASRASVSRPGKQSGSRGGRPIFCTVKHHAEQCVGGRGRKTHRASRAS